MKALLILVVCCILFGCGFHLRGNLVIPPTMQRIAIQSTANYSQFTQNFQILLRQAGGHIVDNPQQADVVLLIDAEQIRKTFESVGTNVQLHQYNLQYSVVYQIKNRQQIPVMPRQQIAASRVYRENANQQLASGEEETVLIGEMQQEVMQNLIARLTAYDTLAALRSSYTRP